MKAFRLFLATLTLILGSAPGSPADGRQPPPNFVFILVDDQGWSATSVAMLPGKDFSRTPYFQMPNVERLAAQGMVFSQAYAGHPKCECSRASLLMGRTTTSLNATTKSARNWNAPAGDSLANTLKRASPTYRAAHLGKWQWPQTPESMGYDVSDGITMNEAGDSSNPDDPKLSFSLTRRAQDYMEKQVQDRHPFFLQISYYAVHNKPQALAATLAKYQDNPNRPGGRGNRTMMAAMSEDLDTCIGLVLQKLGTLGIAENTYVIYMSDNGARTQVLKGGKALCDEGGLRVPLIVAGPGIRGGTFADGPVIGYDIFPTVLDFAAPGFVLPKGIEGGSWKPVLMNAGTGQVKRPIDRMVWHHDVEIEHPQTALRQGDLKLLHYWDTKADFLYDLSADLREENNLAAAKPDIAAKMLAELKAHVRTGLGEQKFAALERGEFERSRLSGGGKVERPPEKRGRSGASRNVEKP